MNVKVKIRFDGEQPPIVLVLNVKENLKGQRLLGNIDKRIQALDLKGWAGWTLESIE